MRAAGLDFGLAGAIVFPFPVIGNSSTAITEGSRARSLTRLAMTDREATRRTYRLFSRNHLYVYPEHRDYDLADLYPAYWSHTVTTQGSSGSDQSTVHALVTTAAAFPPETMEAMRRDGLVGATLHMILRRNLAGISGEGDYLSGRAHRPVIDPGRLRPDRMVAHAASMSPDAVPPMVRLTMMDEDFGASAGLAGEDERLFDTPSAIGRLWRGFEGRKRLRLRASGPPGGGEDDLTFVWRLLQGDPARVSITPDGAEATIAIDWHDPFEVALEAGRSIETSRVDIGVFALAGGQASLPATLSVHFPAHQRRRYNVAPGQQPRLISIDYAGDGSSRYVDPTLYWRADWTDTAIRDDHGALIGWQREAGDRQFKLSADGVSLSEPGMRTRMVVEDGGSRRLLWEGPEP